MVIPRAGAVVRRSGAFVLEPGTPVVAGPELAGVAAWLRGLLPPGPSSGAPGAVRLLLDADLAPEGYVLAVGAGGIDVRGGAPAGVHYGLQTLRQLLPAGTLRRAPITDGPLLVPAVHIEDAPRFAWRGVLLDVARHFLPVADVLRFVDLAAFHK